MSKYILNFTLPSPFSRGGSCRAGAFALQSISRFGGLLSGAFKGGVVLSLPLLVVVDRVGGFAQILAHLALMALQGSHTRRLDAQQAKGDGPAYCERLP